MVPVEQDIHVYENIEKMHHLQQIDRHHLTELPTHDSGIVSLNTSSSQASEQPLILNASLQQRLQTEEREQVKELYDDKYYNRKQFINYTKYENENLHRIASEERLNDNIYETVNKFKDSRESQQSQRLTSESVERIQMIRPNEQTTVIYDTTQQFKQDKTLIKEKSKKIYDTLPSKTNMLRPEQTDVPVIYESLELHRTDPMHTDKIHH
ncbi:unnamed protein product, partial [Didymodactylos carnosus]